MNVFFTASFKGKELYQKEYDLILEKLSNLSVDVVGTEKGNYISTLPTEIKNKYHEKEKLHYEAIKYGINHSDAVVIEMSYPCFRLGHEATLAIQAKKHVLCLSLEEDYSAKINNEYFHGARYSRFNIERILRNFFAEISQEKLKNRFNMFLSDRQLEHVHTRSLLENVTASEYIRELLRSDMKATNTRNSD